MDGQRIDGNGVAGLLAEITGAELTTVVRTCPSCGERRMIGEHHAYQGPGVVLRCPGCDDVALVIGVQEHQLLVEWRGTYVVER